MKVVAKSAIAPARAGTPSVGLADRILDMLEAAHTIGNASLPDLARQCDLALPTAHRLAQSLIARGYLIAYRRGEYALGPASLALGQGLSLTEMLRQASLPALNALSRQCRAHVHLGIFEGDMVTYLVKVRYGRRELTTAEGTQLEAYCSGLGKVLLAQLDAEPLDHYLAAGAFIALTPNTITDAQQLRATLDRVRARGWASDIQEIFPDVSCIAVPIFDACGRGIAAISASRKGAGGDELALSQPLLPLLQETAARISAKLFAPTLATRGQT